MVWAPSPVELAVQCSSATCINCKQIVFCMEHFVELYTGHARYECPHCQSTAWWVAVYGADTLTEELSKGVEVQGGSVEHHQMAIVEPPVLQADATEPPIIEDVDEDSVAELAPALTEWTLLRRSDLPPAFEFLGLGIAARRHSDGVDVIAHRATHELPRCAEPPSAAACSRSGRRLVVQVRDERGQGIILCRDSSHSAAIALRARPGDRLGTAVFIDEVRFAYLVTDPSGRTAVFEGAFDGPRRVRSRRVASLGMLAQGPGLLAVGDGREALITGRRQGNHFELISIRLRDNSIVSLALLGAKPRRLVAAERGSRIAWISLDGEIRHSAAGERSSLIGRTDENLLAITSDGQRLAWVNSNRLEVADLAAGAIHQRPVQSGVIQIIPKD